MSKEKILKQAINDITLQAEHSVNDLKFIKATIANVINKVREETIREAIRKIEKIKIAVAKQAGAFKYDSCYEDCIDILNKLKK
jgi:hypothetical protein